MREFFEDHLKFWNIFNKLLIDLFRMIHILDDFLDDILVRFFSSSIFQHYLSILEFENGGDGKCI